MVQFHCFLLRITLCCLCDTLTGFLYIPISVDFRTITLWVSHGWPMFYRRKTDVYFCLKTRELSACTSKLTKVLSDRECGRIIQLLLFPWATLMVHKLGWIFACKVFIRAVITQPQCCCVVVSNIGQTSPCIVCLIEFFPGSHWSTGFNKRLSWKYLSSSK